MSNLALDFGNTNRKVGVFDHKNLVRKYSFNEKDFQVSLLEDIVSEHRPDRIIISSTSYLNELESNWLTRNNALEVSEHLNYPFQIMYETPNTLGRDRLAAVSAAFSLYRGSSILVIDAGTCITYDFITKDGIYLGGNIAPGLDLRIHSMHDYSDKLPLVSKKMTVDKLLGITTESALQNGAILMAVMAAKELIRQLEVSHGEINTILTGGDHNFFDKYLNSKIFVHPDLVLFGLNEILINNEV